MFTETITLTDAIDGIRRIVERFGYNHTPKSAGGSGCIYAEVKDGALHPVCIVGQFFADRGVLRALLTMAPDLSVARGAPAQYEACNVGLPLWNDLEQFGIIVEHEAREFLRAVQIEQDASSPWGLAFNNSIQTIREKMKERAIKQVKEDNSYLFSVWPVTSPQEPLADWERDLRDYNEEPPF